MNKLWRQRISLFVVWLLAIQTVFGSIPVLANVDEILQVTITAEDAPYIEGIPTTSPVTIQVTATTADSANIQVELSKDEGNTWMAFDMTAPLILTEAGNYSIWFRIVGQSTISKHSIAIANPQPSLLAMSNIIYVKEGMDGDGTSWINAFGNLQQALDVATKKAKPVQIWVAEGTYTPTKQTDSSDPRTASFRMQYNVAIYGGFKGTEINLAERDWQKYKTILSGDIGEKDIKSDNAYHVFYADAIIDEKAILDGVIITGGNADNNQGHNTGGGMIITGNPTLTNVTFIGNTANSGAGMIVSNSSPELTNVTFIGNIATNGGGGMYNMNSSPKLMNVMFTGNKALFGGGMGNFNGSNPILMDVEFIGNEARHMGSAINNGNNASTINNSNNPILINVTMSDNLTTSTNKGVIAGDKAQIYNSIIVGNKGEPALNNVEGTIENSLLDVAEGGKVLAKLHRLTTDIQPNTYTPEDIFMDASQQNYQLRAGSPAINKGNNAINTKLTDLLGNLRVQGSLIDLGAYESKFAYHVVYDATHTTGDIPVDKLTYKQGDPITVQNRGNLARIGFTFASWNTQADGQGDDYAEGDTFTMGTSNQILYAKWIPISYKVTFESNGGSNVVEQQILYSEKVSEPSVPSKEGHTFVGWYTDGNEEWDFATDIVTKEITLYAKWTANNYTVTFESNGGSNVAEQQILYSEKVSEPSVPSKEGHTFAGWYKDTGFIEQWDFATDVVMEHTILYAKWIANPTYAVTYDANGATDGEVPEDIQKYEENASVTVKGNSSNLIKTGYTFAGWNTQADGKGLQYAEKATFQMGTANITLYAQWTANPSPPPTNGGSNPPPISNNNDAPPPAKVTITLHTNGGTAIAPIDIAYNTKISDLPIPTREGYRFVGWYQDEELTKPWTVEMVLRENISLYAKWTALPVEEPAPLQEPQPVTFSDIERHWAKEMIEELASAGIIQGYEDGTFRPNEPISRMHVAVLVGRAFTFESRREVEKFSDVSPTHPYYEAIMALQQAGIVDGSNGTFLPAENMTRAQMAKVLVGIMGRTPEGTSSFVDVDQKHWSAGYIAVLEQEGIALGDNGKFNPNVPVTRAQFVTFLYRVLQTVDS